MVRTADPTGFPCRSVGVTEAEVCELLVERCVERAEDIRLLYRVPKDRNDPAAGDDWLATVERTMGVDEFEEPRTCLVMIDDATGAILHSHVVA